MTRAQRTLLACAALSAVVACAPKEAAPPAAVDTSADVAAVKAAQDRELVAVSSGNTDTVLSVFASDAVFMPPGEPALVGSAAMRPWVDGMNKAVTMSGKYTTADVQVVGDVAIVHYTGALTVTPKAKGAKPMTETIKGIHIFKRQADGSWKIAQDVWNTDAPTPAPAR